jgi:hypothetical protein
MQRIALLLILAAVPLLCASMLAQSSDTSVDGTMRASLASGNYASANQCFQGQWSSTLDIAQESSCTTNGFPTSAQPTRAVARQHNIAGQSKSIHALISGAHLQPVYEKLADPQLVEHSRSDVAKLYFLRPASQPMNPPDHQKVGSPSEFTREWKQNAKTAEIHSVAQIERAESFRASIAARTRNGVRPTYSQRDGDSENNCLISEEDARPAQQYQGIVITTLAGATMKDSITPEKLRASEEEIVRTIESSQIWSEIPAAVAKGMKVKKSVAVK